jgi:hypothetical protein
MNAAQPSRPTGAGARWRQRVTFIATMVAVAMLLWLLAAAAAELSKASQAAVAVNPDQPATFQAGSEAPAGPQADHADLPGLFPTPTTASDLVLLRPGDRVLDAEPADLPPPANAVRQVAFARQDAAAIEQFAVWRASGEIGALAEFYRQAAAERGFVPVPAPSANHDTISPMWRRQDQVLVARLSPAAADGGHAVQIVLWLRRPAEAGV